MPLSTLRSDPDRGRLRRRIAEPFARFDHPRLAGCVVGGLFGGIGAAACLVLAVAVGLAVSTKVGVLLTWIAVVGGALSAGAFVVGLVGYPVARVMR